MNRFYCFMVLLMMSICDASKLNTERQNHKVKKPLKSIKSPDGDIIDCILISHQPAFDHPLLKNHTIQMRPTYYPKGIFGEETKRSNFNPHGKDDSSKPITQLWHLNGRCPDGTVSIRRTKQEDIMRARSVNSFGKKRKNRFSQLPSATIVNGVAHPHAFVAADQSINYYGTKAIINVWNPQVQDPREFSLAQVWVLGGTSSNLNSIEAGWTVDPIIFGDKNTRLFVYWTSDNYQHTGCYNLLCSGFVQTSNNMAVGGSISPLSTYQGSQHEITILVWKDPKQGLWWLNYGDETIGYWPTSLFQYLTESASLIEWGGEVVNYQSGGQHTTTQMGSGHFAEEGLNAASYFRNLEVVDASNALQPPPGLRAIAEEPNCYTISLQQNNDWGNYFFFGGPGRNPNCP